MRQQLIQKPSVLVIAFTLLVVACEKIIPEAPGEDELLDGPIEGLLPSELAQFEEGDVAFSDEIFTIEKGLGPLFVTASCGSCHPGDGKGHPFTTLTRFGQTRPNTAPDLKTGAPQLQNRAIPGYEPEVVPPGTPSMKLTPPAVTGLGLLAALTDAQIMANADPNDANRDGISGVPNYVAPRSYFVRQDIHEPVNGKYVGRFGKKAAAIDLLQQTAGAYNQDMGITSTMEPLDPYSLVPVDPEVSDQTVKRVVFYLRTLKAPIQRTPDDPQVLEGKEIFQEIQCGACHRPQWTTPESDIAALSNITFFPYTDLLLHDMGPGLDDGVTEGSATTSEWKTPPLWGLGLSPKAQGGQYFLLHDGRAGSIEEAILLHGGEAMNSKNKFEALSQSEKEALLRFLESL